MKILLVYPEMPETCWTFQKEIELGGFKSAIPPLGLLTIAAMLPQKWDKKLVDQNVEELTDKDIKWADYVFLGGMNVQELSIRKVIKKCRELNTPIVGGGPLFTHEYSRFPEIDHFVLNEAEITLPQFIKDLEEGNLKKIYKTNEFADIKNTPIPLWSIAKMKRYASVMVQYSRGCPFMCDFCDVTSLFGKKSRVKTADQIINELNSIPDINGLGLVTFADDNLIGNKHELKTNLLPALAEWQNNREHKIWLATQLSINLADDHVLMQQLLEAGFGSVFIGLETPDEVALISCNKTQNRSRSLFDNVKFLQESGFEVWAGFIVGFDSDKPDIFERQFELIQQSGIVLANISLLNAPVGTELIKQMKLQNRLLDKTWSHEGISNIIPIMDVETLYNGFYQLVKSLYEKEDFNERAKIFLRMYQLPKIHKNSKFILRAYMIRGLFAGLFTLGVLDENRKYFWKLLFWTIKNRPEFWARSLAISMRGRHFRLSYQKNIELNRSKVNEIKEAQKLFRQNTTDRKVQVINE